MRSGESARLIRAKNDDVTERADLGRGRAASGRHTALIAGYTGAVGSALARELAGRAEWRVYGLARRPPADPEPAGTVEARGTVEPAGTGVPGVTGVAADMADRAGGAAGGRAAHRHHPPVLLRARHPRRAGDRGCRRQPRAAGQRGHRHRGGAAGGLRHVHLVQGGKYYGVHIGPFPTPAKESQPRPPIDNFNYDQQDYLSARAAAAQWTWSASRPNTLVHFSPAIARNLVSTLGAYAAICRELGAALDFPGPQAAYDSLTQLTTIELLARAIAWMATEPACANEAFNVTNTDLFRWHALWPRLAEAFGMPLGSVRPVRLAEVMAGHGELWRRVCARHGLVQPRLDRVANWGYADATLERTWDEILSHNKARRLGFHDWDVSLARFFLVLDKYRQAGILPS